MSPSLSIKSSAAPARVTATSNLPRSRASIAASTWLVAALLCKDQGTSWNIQTGKTSTFASLIFLIVFQIDPWAPAFASNLAIFCYFSQSEALRCLFLSTLDHAGLSYRRHYGESPDGTWFCLLARISACTLASLACLADQRIRYYYSSRPPNAVTGEHAASFQFEQRSPTSIQRGRASL